MATGFFYARYLSGLPVSKAHNKELIFASYVFGVLLVCLSSIMAYTKMLVAIIVKGFYESAL